jgi:signal transduction histidine kinase
MNLVSNALKFTFSGKITIKVTLQPDDNNYEN